MFDAEQKIKSFLRITAQQGASDLHLSVGRYPTLRIDGKLRPLIEEEILTPAATKEIADFFLNEEKNAKLLKMGHVDFSYNFEDKARFRTNIFFQQSYLSIAMRLIPQNIRSLAELNMPDALYDFTKYTQGLVLIVGPIGHGKSTTMAAIINEINKTQEKHIITVEDPIEYVYQQDKCIIDQREVFQDTESFQTALKAIFREDANVVSVGEMRDLETISTVMTAAETGHLIFGTLHTNDAAQTVDRIIDVFPSHQQNQIRFQLASVLLGVISQRLVPKIDGGRIPAVEIMMKTHAVENLIRENKTYQIGTTIETGAEMGMVSMDSSLADLVRKGLISPEMALSFARDANNFQILLKR
jgi:twitching motility protein PilT